MKKIATWLLCLALAGAILLPVQFNVNSTSVDNSNPQLLADDPPPPIPPRPPDMLALDDPPPPIPPRPPDPGRA